MTKKKAILTVTEDLRALFSGKSDGVEARKASKPTTTNRSNKRNTNRLTDRFTIEKALATVTRQMD